MRQNVELMGVRNPEFGIDRAMGISRNTVGRQFARGGILKTQIAVKRGVKVRSAHRALRLPAI